MNFLIQIDYRLFFLINNGLGCKWLDPFFEDLSWLGGWTIGLVALAFLAETGRRVFLRHLLVLLVVLVCLTPVNTLIKRAVNRSRPSRVFNELLLDGNRAVADSAAGGIRVLGQELYRHSFPSGHSAFAFFFMTYAGMYKRAYRFWAMVLATLIAFSRVYVGAHFPSDCLAGALLGMLGGWIAWQIFLRLNRRLNTVAERSS